MEPQINKVMENAHGAFKQYRSVSGSERAQFLEAIADEIEALGDVLIQTAMSESNLPEARLMGERGRTTGQLRMFASVAREGSWVEATIDSALPERTPPRPDIRKMLKPLGPIVVFGASNFPLAFSTAGGDTASALAAGCPVVIKAHPGHPETSRLVFGAIQHAISKTNMPTHTVQHVDLPGIEPGRALVSHPLTAGVGFTGSQAAGRSLFDLAAARRQPIPVFAEMGSVNPVLLLPDAANTRGEALANQYAGSLTLGAGQFCTNPGLLFALDTEDFKPFKDYLSSALHAVQASAMLHEGISSGFEQKLHAALGETGVQTLIEGAVDGLQVRPGLAEVSGAEFLKNPKLHEEVFGPFALLVVCRDADEMLAAWRAVSGQLTTTILGDASDLEHFDPWLSEAEQIAGRIIFNGMPTGVEVCPAMVHGGPYPACTDSRFTAIGKDAIRRWARPVCYQDCPSELLPPALQDENPLGIHRTMNGVLVLA
jgi:NADP-dependent aldehyde dehydrogenase